MPGALAGAPSRKNTIAQRRLHVHALTAPRMTACNSLPGGKARRQITQRINAESLSTPIFRDTSAEPGHAYSYWVTAVDLAHNESSPSPAVEVETR